MTTLADLTDNELTATLDHHKSELARLEGEIARRSPNRPITVSKLTEIKNALAAATQGKWEWHGRIALDWGSDSFSAVDDLRVEIATPEKEYDADLWFVLQGMKSGSIMVRNTDAELIASAPDYLRALLAVAEAAAALMQASVDYDTYKVKEDALKAALKALE